MGASTDQIEREIGATRDAIESRIVELRQRGEKQVNRARQALLVAAAPLVAAALGAAIGVIAVGALIVYRYSRPLSKRERLARLVPPAVLKDLASARQTLEVSLGRRLPPMRLYVNDRQVGKKQEPSRVERLIVSGIRAAATAAVGEVFSRAVTTIRSKQAQ